MAKRHTAPFRHLNFTSSLPGEVTFLRNSKATCRNANGKLIEVGLNAPRLDHTEDGAPLGLRIEHGATNKCTNYNINPVDTSGLSTAGTGTINVVDDTAELLAAGLDLICTSGTVYKAEATTGSTFIVYFSGNTNNINKHSMSIYARGEGGSGTTARLALGGAELHIAETGGNYQHYAYENLTPDKTTRKMTIAINGNETLYFILNQLEESTECSSLIPVEGSSVTRPTERAYVTDVEQYDWFTPEHGYMICRYTHHKFTGSDAYIAVLNNGGSSNTIGFRVTGSNHDLKGYIRAASSSQHASSNADYQLAGTLISAGLRWNSTDADILSGAKVKNSTMSQLPTGINALEIGARNGGAGSMNGYISSLEIGTQNLSLQQLGNRMQKSTDMCTIGAGQSLIRGHFISQADGSNQGKQKLREIIGQAEAENAFIILDGSTGSSAASKTTDAVNFWWDLATSARGPAFDTFYQEINDVGAKPTTILWGQGEADSHVIDVYTSTTEYKQASEAIFDDMRQTLGDVQIYIQRIGRRTDLSNMGGIQAIRDIQAELIASNTWCHEAAETYDLALYDNVHLTNNAYETTAQRNAIALMNAAGARGPIISSASRSDVTITVTLSHDNGDDFTPSALIEAFTFLDNAVPITITNAVKADSTTIHLTLNSTPSSGIETLYYGHDDMAGLNINNVIIDNAEIPMPLRTVKVVLI
jgi:hypothetical protein